MCVSAVNGQDRFVDTRQLLGIRRELGEVRDKVNGLVDAIDSARIADGYSSATTASSELVVSLFTVNVNNTRTHSFFPSISVSVFQM